ncbi:hypothetical protein WKK05_29110 [Nostoc sp. UHCC 0302]|uniref:hypothetical protein n=1 Tax=Nostoc sp. UHCC 0302 TaxID=3134896 RepID=UPI00311C96CC
MSKLSESSDTLLNLLFSTIARVSLAFDKTKYPESWRSLIANGEWKVNKRYCHNSLSSFLGRVCPAQKFMPDCYQNA